MEQQVIDLVDYIITTRLVDSSKELYTYQTSLAYLNTINDYIESKGSRVCINNLNDELVFMRDQIFYCNKKNNRNIIELLRIFCIFSADLLKTDKETQHKAIIELYHSIAKLRSSNC